MKNMLKGLALATFAISFAAGAETITSPSGNLTLNVDTDAQGSPTYSLDYKGRPVVQNSRLGLKGKEATFAQGMKIAATATTAADEMWAPVWGQADSVRNHYNELLVTFADRDNAEKQMSVRFRLFDDGLGFRYEFEPQKSLAHWQITDELTEFNLPGDPTLYCTPGDYDTDEYLYTTTAFSGLQQALNQGKYHHTEGSTIPQLSVQTPLMIKEYTDTTSPLYVNIHEANLRNYGGMQLYADPANSSLQSLIIPDRLGVAAYVKMPFHTPWRTIVVSDDARHILASNLIYNLNDPCALEDTSWIKPTKFMGVWWQMFQGDGSSWAYSDEFFAKPGETDYSKLTHSGHHPANNENVRRYIDFAAAHNIPALLVEGWNQGWEDWAAYNKNRQFRFDLPYPDFDVDALQAYANERGVRLIMHHETAGNAADYERQLPQAFAFMNHHGYNAVKTGYVGNIIPRSEHHASQWMVDHYLYVAQKAAEHKIMVDSHEAVRPTGLIRTYPNWLAQESARGGEFESMGGNPPEHTCLLPFTRLMGGPMDYTPGLFEPHPSHVSKGGKVEGGSTLAKQLGLYLVIPSPVQMACDLPWNYEKYLDAFKFIEDVPVEWSETHYLEAEPGDYITVARREKNSDNWYVGGITDENARTAVIDLSFLPKGVDYQAVIYGDAPNADYRTAPTAYTITSKKVNSKTKLKQNLVPGGGFAIQLLPLKK